jgi:hypothetical protein
MTGVADHPVSILRPGAAWKRGLALTQLNVCGTPREAPYAIHFGQQDVAFGQSIPHHRRNKAFAGDQLS